MPEKTGNEQDATWTQTLTMVTPEEDARIRTINETTVVSAPGGTPLDLGLNQIADRRTVQMNTPRRDLFVDTVELTEGISHSNVACQTFLQGVPKVELPSSCTNEATQTLYMGHDSSHTRPFRDITKIMNDRITPVAGKRTEYVQTVISFELDASKNQIVDGLSTELTEEQLEKDYSPELQAMTAASTYATDSLHFILDRVFWLTDPGYDPTQLELNDEAAQTSIKYDHGLGKVVLDADTQTSLSCEPGRSNTSLLSGWSAIKDIARSIIDECLETGAIVHSIIDEIEERCAGQIHGTYGDKAVQTLARCNALTDKNDEVLRKLRLEVVTDPFESSIISLPLVETLVEMACRTVHQDAPVVAAEILDRIQTKSATIAKRLAAIRFEAGSHKKPMDDILDARRKRLKELLRNRVETKQCSSTQTELAGVPEIGRLKEPSETVCSTCPRHSECYVCEASLENSSANAAGKNQDPLRNRILKTRDILIAYNPCYVVTTPPEIPQTRPRVMPKRLSANIHPRPPLRTSASNSSSRERQNSDGSLRDAVPHGPPGPRPAGSSRSQNQGSLSDWARVVQETSSVSGAWSIRGSSSADSNTIDRQAGTSSPTHFPRNHLVKECPRSGCDIPVRSIKALRVLKKTFNRNEESCSDCSYNMDEQSVKPGQGWAVRTGTPCVINGGESSKPAGMEIIDREELRDFSMTVRRPNETPDGEGVRVVPIIHVTNGIDSKN